MRAAARRTNGVRGAGAARYRPLVNVSLIAWGRVMFRCVSCGVAAAIAIAWMSLPAKAEPVEYVRVCDAYGAGFFYIPGTETCLRIRGGVDAGFSHYSGNISNVFARNAGATQSSSVSGSETSGRVGLDLRGEVPIGPNVRAFAGAWVFEPTDPIEFRSGITYALNDTAYSSISYRPNSFTVYGGGGYRLGNLSDTDIYLNAYGGLRRTTVDLSLTGLAAGAYWAHKRYIDWVGMGGLELALEGRQTPGRLFGSGWYGALGIQLQGGTSATLQATAPGAVVTSQFEVKPSWHGYFSVGVNY